MIIEVNNLVKRYKELIALDHFRLEVEEGSGTSGTERKRENNGNQLYAGSVNI